MKLSEKQGIFLLNFAKLIIWVNEQEGCYVTAGELLRPQLMQDHYADTGKSKTRAGKHTDKLAGDLNLFINGIYQKTSAAYKPLGDYWVSLHPNNRWGGDWNRDGHYGDESFQDPFHFEMI